MPDNSFWTCEATTAWWEEFGIGLPLNQWQLDSKVEYLLHEELSTSKRTSLHHLKDEY